MIINFKAYLEKFAMSTNDNEMLTELEFLASYKDDNIEDDELYYSVDNEDDVKKLILKNIYLHLKYIKNSEVVSYEMWNMLRLLVLNGMELNIIKENKLKAYLNILLTTKVNCHSKYEINICLKEMASLKLQLINLDRPKEEVKTK